MASAPLQRILGTPTALLIGMGVAIGSGIFRTPGEVAGSLAAGWAILLCWLLGGLIVLMQGMVTTELATRFPKAGGEYVYLREAYGDFVAFFFGWGYTVFVIGGGAATIAAACGDFAVDLLGLSERRSGLLAGLAIAIVTLLNCLGLRMGAWTQNALTGIKILVLLGLTVACFAGGSAAAAPTAVQSGGPTISRFVGAMLAILWSYDGTTDAVKMAEEVKDVRRAMPIAVLGSTLALTVLYVVVNAALLRVVPAAEMAGLASAPGEAMRRLMGESGQKVVLVAGVVICLGSLSSTTLATVRVTFALARDGLAFAPLARMSATQSPVAAMLLVGGCAFVLVLNRSFREILAIYFFASAILFGLSYGSLLVFRLRETTFPRDVFRCPLGYVQALLLIVLHVALGIHVAVARPRDAAWSGLLLIALAGLYFVWKRPGKPESPTPSVVGG